MAIVLSNVNGVPPNNADYAKEAPTSDAGRAPISSESVEIDATGKFDETGNHRISSDNYPSKPQPKKPQEWRTFTATAYVALCDTGCTGITATGIDVRHTRYYHGRVVVAVDPKVIPMGTKLTIRLADGSTIEGIAQDTGGAIKGRKIDVLMASKEAAWDFGKQKVSVKINE